MPLRNTGQSSKSLQVEEGYNKKGAIIVNGASSANTSLENRCLDDPKNPGCVIPALDERWVPQSLEFIEFYVPSEIKKGAVLSKWVRDMSRLICDLSYMLSASHHEFWSTIVCSNEFNEKVLGTFLEEAPRFFDKRFEAFTTHKTTKRVYVALYQLFFRVFMRIATHKESEENYITPKIWAGFLYDSKIFDFPRMLTISLLFQGKGNTLLPGLLETVMQHEKRCENNLDATIPIIMDKFEDCTQQLESLLKKSRSSTRDVEGVIDELLTLVISVHKFLNAYPPGARSFLLYPSFLSSLAAAYESHLIMWSKVVNAHKTLKPRVTLLRVYILRLFRFILAQPTILCVEKCNDRRLDEFFEALTGCLEERHFLHDYEVSYPFRTEMKTILRRGIYIDETRIEYMANAIASCFYELGEEYPAEKITVDPMYDPNFDRQLLGACSLDVTGVALKSLITQVKDLLPDLPDPYVEAVLKHYNYSSESAINALLEGSVPPRFDKYKDPENLRSPKPAPEELVKSPISDNLPVKDMSESVLHVGKRSHGFASMEDFMKQSDNDKSFKNELKSKIYEGLEADQVAKEKRMEEAENERKSRFRRNLMDDFNNVRIVKDSYIPENLLPYREDAEYDDEYDDTYDEVGVGMTEPDNQENWSVKPLNKKAAVEEIESEEDENETRAKNPDDFVDDPAIIRAQRQRRYEDMSANRRGPPPRQRDVVGKAKGQGQDKDVLYNRRQKTAHKDAGHRRGADAKRREF